MCLSLGNEGNLIELGGLGWIPADYVATIEQRARIVNALCGSDIVITHVGAYWIYTGIPTVELSRSLHIRNSSMTSAKRHPRNNIPPEDIAIICSTQLTTKERTIIDLLRDDLAIGMEALCLLMRSGASFDHVLHIAQRLKNNPGMRNVRELLYQLPTDVIENINSHHASV